jgi:hypothetical protein
MILASCPGRSLAFGHGAATSTGDATLEPCDPALVPLFTPPHPHMGHYEVCASSEPIRAVNGGPIETLEALDAFGAAGTYDRPALSRLYGGTRVQVARGWAMNGRRFESITRLSPYPDLSLTHLRTGTLEVRFVAILSP